MLIFHNSNKYSNKYLIMKLVLFKNITESINNPHNNIPKHNRNKSVVKYNFLDESGKPAVDKDFDYASDFKNGLAVVRQNSTFNILDESGNFLLNTWDSNTARIKRIFENKSEEKRRERAHQESLNVIRKHFNNASWLDQEFKHQDNPNHMSAIDYMLYHFEEEFFHAPRPSKPIIRLEPLFCKLAFEANFQNDNPNTEKLNRLAAILNYIEGLYKTGRLELNTFHLNQTYDQLNQTYGTEIDKIKQEEEDKINNTTYDELNTSYEIIKYPDYKTCHEIGNYSFPQGKLCYTQSESTFNNYTDNGQNDVFILLKKNFKEIKPEHDGKYQYENLQYSAYDTYGLSMIFIFVNQFNSIAYCNTRWNHDAEFKLGHSTDHALNKEEISTIIGENFNKLFTNRNPIDINKLNERLAAGEDPSKIFSTVLPQTDEISIVELNAKWNAINTKTKRIISNTWFDHIANFENGFARVKKDGKYNFINTNGNLISDKWFEHQYHLHDFTNGFSLITKEDGYWDFKYNFIDTKGNLISNTWFDQAMDFKNGFARIVKDNKGNYIDTNGNIISDIWFDKIFDFENNMARVKKDNKWNFINSNGNLILDSNTWFDSIYDFKEGFAQVVNNHKSNFIDTNGNLVSDIWFDRADDFKNGFARVTKDDKWNFLDTEGYFISNTWLNIDFEENFKNGFARVRKNDKWNLIDTEGNLISDKWFDSVTQFTFTDNQNRQCAAFSNNDKKYIIYADGTIGDYNNLEHN